MPGRFCTILAILLAPQLLSCSIVFAKNEQPLTHGRHHAVKRNHIWLSAYQMMKNGTYYSPDHKYFAVVDTYTDEEVPPLEAAVSIYETEMYRRGYKLDILDGVCPGIIHGLAWLPGHGHWLMFGSISDPGLSMLAIWSGGLTARSLHHHTDPSLDPDWQSDRFILNGYSPDGRKALFSWSLETPSFSPDKQHCWTIWLPLNEQQLRRYTLVKDRNDIGLKAKLAAANRAMKRTQRSE